VADYTKEQINENCAMVMEDMEEPLVEALLLDMFVHSTRLADFQIF
jgi:hypothetical protein